jgi:hypothetical protein
MTYFISRMARCSIYVCRSRGIMEWARVKGLQSAISALCATAVFLKGLGDGATWIMLTWKWHHGIGQPQGMRVCMFLLSHLEDKGKAADRGGLRKSAASLQQASCCREPPRRQFCG